MNHDLRHTTITIIRRVRLRNALKPIRCLAGSDAHDVDFLAIAQMTDNAGFGSFDLVFLRCDGAAFPWMGFESLKIAKDQAHAMIGIEYVEWEPCNVEISNAADRTVNWERALPGVVPASCI